EVLEQQARGAVVLDTRDPEVFARGHLRGSVNVGIGGRFAEYAGTVVPHDVPIVLVGDAESAVLEATLRLGRIGYDTVAGAWVRPEEALVEHPDLVEQASQLTAVDLRHRLD